MNLLLSHLGCLCEARFGNALAPFGNSNGDSEFRMPLVRLGTQCGAKQFMKKKTPLVQRAGTTGRAYHPDRARNLMLSIKGELELIQRRVISYEELGRWVDQAGSTAFDKFQKHDQPQVEALLGWLERLPESTRTRLLNSCCRCFPTFESPRLTHDPAQIGSLRALAQQANGFTIVQGASDSARTFVATAVGHECSVSGGPSGRVCGIDRHAPDWFVPLEEVVYLHNLLDPSLLREAVHHFWPLIVRAKHRLIILNGIWNATQTLAGEIVEMASNVHVLLADDFGSQQEDLVRRAPRPSHSLHVSDERDGRLRINVVAF